MPLFALAPAVFVLLFETFVQQDSGVVGFFALALLTIGAKTRNPTCAGLGVIGLVLLLQPALG
ncbi:hypothetical protein [Streptomyces sp. NBC_00344]|uniref:hypothetical protein n=1 Tax=Streptomyces sp. NBC_00344 TaxID=2975720 RepID=UPI002E1D2D33